MYCIAATAKRCILEPKLLLTAYEVVYEESMRNRPTKIDDLDLCIVVV